MPIPARHQWLPGHPLLWVVFLPVAIVVGAACLRVATGLYNRYVAGGEGPAHVKMPSYNRARAISLILLVVNFVWMFIFAWLTGKSIVAARMENQAFDFTYPSAVFLANIVLLALLARLLLATSLKTGMALAGIWYGVILVAACVLGAVLLLLYGAFLLVIYIMK